jgi:hypothetical protein
MLVSSGDLHNVWNGDPFVPGGIFTLDLKQHAAVMPLH